MLIVSGTHALMHWLLRLGGPGLVLLAQVDNSPIPIPGSQDLLLIILASSRKDLWLYYALMATTGAVIAGYISYRISAKGGKETLEKKLGKDRAKKVYNVFARYGFFSVFLGALAPPPIPMSAFIMAAGAMQYPVKKFLAALTLGRAIRYTLVAYLASLYGRAIIHWAARYYKPMLGVSIALGVGAGLLVLYHVSKGKRRKSKPEKSPASMAV
jgi:membrane protein YqaA with SNARE-associated domain